MAGDRPATRRTLDLVRAVDPSLVGAAGVAIAALAVYRATLLPGLGYWDTAEAQTVPPILGTMHAPGFPAYAVLGWLATFVLRPLGSPAFAMNLLSALLTAFAAGATVLVARRLGAGLAAAVAVATAFALTPIVWHIALAADAHALHLALLVAVVLGLLRWESLVSERRDRPDDRRLRARGDRAIVLTAALFGLAVANHGLALLLVPSIGLYVLAVEPRVVLRPRVVVGALAACLGVAALLFLELPLRAGPFRATPTLVYGHPETLGGFLDVVLARQFLGHVGGLGADLARKAGDLVAFAASQLGPLVVLLPAGLLITAVRRPRYALLSVTATATTCLFAASYANADIGRYYLGPAFFAWTWLAVLLGAIVERVVGLGRRAGDPGDEPGDDRGDEPHAAPGVPAWRSPRAAGAVILAGALLVPTAIDLDARWHAADRSADTSAPAWLDEAFAALKPGAVVISWWSYSTPMWYGQLIEGRRPDVWVVDDRTRVDDNLGEVPDVIAAWLGRRPVYLIRVQESDLLNLITRFVIEPVGRPGNLYEVTGRLETSP